MDETGLTQRYDVHLKWTHYPLAIEHEELMKTVRNELGLALEPAERTVELWVIESRQ